MNLHDYDLIQLGKREGREEGLSQGIQLGLSQGRRDTQLETAKLMLSEGDSAEKIVRVTSLDMGTVLGLKKSESRMN